MGLRDGKEPNTWMKARRWHTYEGRPIDEGDFYLAHEDMVETIEVLGFAKRDEAPPRAARRPVEPVVPAVPVLVEDPVVAVPAVIDEVVESADRGVFEALAGEPSVAIEDDREEEERPEDGP
jgi:hypothetical protein